MKGKRVTIYDLASKLGISASYVSRALNNHPSISDKMKKLVRDKAVELNYKHNSHAANLRRGSSKTIGVIVPKINENFFAHAIAGIEEVCFAHDHSLIICQSDESFKKEKIAIDTLISKNVDCMLISVSLETKTSDHLQEILQHHIHLIQFDRYFQDINSYIITSDNHLAAFNATTHLIKQGFSRIAYLGGPDHIAVFRDRKEGFLHAIRDAGLSVPDDFVVENALSKEAGAHIAGLLLRLDNPPQAFFAASDYAALGVMQTAGAMGIQVPQHLALIGFANEEFTELIQPTLSSVDQKSKEMGRCAASLYFTKILDRQADEKPSLQVIHSELIIRESSSVTAKKKREPVEQTDEIQGNK
jgi:DNA-binding LacI/PurR family transcriptional regulator